MSTPFHATVAAPAVPYFIGLTTPADPQIPIRLAGIMGAMLQSIEAGVTSQTALRRHYGAELRAMIPAMTSAALHHPVLLRPIATIARFADCQRTYTGNVVPPLDLRDAAAAVYSHLSSNLAPQDKLMVDAAIEVFSLVKTLGDSVPPPAHVELAYNRLSRHLREELDKAASKLTGERRGQKHLGASLSQSALFLRAAAIDWFVAMLRNLIKPAQTATEREGDPYLPAACREIAEILDWFCHVPPSFCHDFFQMLLRDPLIKERGGMAYIRKIVDLVNRHTGSSFYVGTELRSGGSRADRDRIWRIKRLTADKALQERIEQIIPNGDARALIIKHAACPHELFFSQEGLRDALRTAFISLHPFDKEGPGPEETKERLLALAGVLELFLADPPLLEQRYFFRSLAQSGAIPHERQIELISAINELIKPGYRLRFCQDIFVERAGEPSGRLDRLNAGRRSAWEKRNQGGTGMAAGPAPVKTAPPPSRIPPKTTSHPHPHPVSAAASPRLATVPPPAAVPATPPPPRPAVPKPAISLEVGALMVYPGIGVGTVTVESRRTGKETPQKSYVLYIPNGFGTTVKVAIPFGSQKTRSLRRPIDRSEVDEVFAVLGKTPKPLSMGENNEKQIRNMQSQISKGSILELAALFRDLSACKREETGFSPWRRHMIDLALHNLAAELSVVLGQPYEEMKDRIREALLPARPKAAGPPTT